ncbi:EamA family transporter [Spirosoma areae]
MPTYLVYALLSTAFAGLTAVLAKVGLSAISSDLGLAIRTTVVYLAVIIQFLSWHSVSETKQLTSRAILFLVLSGLATAGSWIFYYKAVKIGPVSEIALIDKGSIVITVFFSYLLLHEPLTPKLLLGLTLIVAGLLVMIWK